MDYLRNVSKALFRPTQGFPLATTTALYDELDRRENATALPCSSSPSSSSSSLSTSRSPSPVPSTPLRRSPRRRTSSDLRSSSESPSTAATSPASSPAPLPAPNPSSGPVTRKRAREQQGGAGAGQQEEDISVATKPRSSLRLAKKARPLSIAGPSSASAMVKVPSYPRPSRKRTAAAVDEEEGLSEAGPTSSSSSSSSSTSARFVKRKVFEVVEPLPVLRGYRKERSSRSKRRVRFEPVNSDAPVTLAVQLGDGEPPIQLEEGKLYVTDSREAFDATLTAMAKRLEQKTAEMAARQGKRPSSVPRDAWARAASSGSTAYDKARRRASAAAATSDAASETDSDNSETDDGVGSLAPFSRRRTEGKRLTEIASDDEEEEPKPKPKPKASVKSKECAPKPKTRGCRRHPSPPSSSAADTDADVGAGAVVHHDPVFQGGEIDWTMTRHGGTHSDTSFRVTRYTDGRIFTEAGPSRW